VTEFFDRELNQHREQALHARRRFFRRRTKLAIVLFALTCVSVFAAGTYLGQGLMLPLQVFLRSGGQIIFAPTPAMLWQGLSFSACVMAILMAHEMGHFLQALRHRVPATLPFFIPFPITPFGTMGAVIMQDAGQADRRKLFDIAVSGPIAGLLLAIPITWYGVAHSTVEAVNVAGGVVRYGDPLLLRWIVTAVHGSYGPGEDVVMNAPLFAGWVGIFITALNLLPVGQLDGGHILYTLIGRRAHIIAYVILGIAFAWMALTGQLHYALIVVLLLIFGPRHPPTANDRIPLGIGRTLLGWAMLGFVIIGFTPTPILM